jgi:signal transduction histidine kinase
MLHEFIDANRAALIQRCRASELEGNANASVDLSHGIPTFLDQLVKTLRVEQGDAAHLDQGIASRILSGPAGGDRAVLSQIGESAALHGRELLRQGFTVNHVIHAYGNVCQAITAMAVQCQQPVTLPEFRTLNRCLDNAIAEAVTEYNYQQSSSVDDANEQALTLRLGYLAHELRSLLNAATLALSAIKTGNVGLTGATGGVLDRSLIGLRNLIDRSLSEVRVTAGLPARHQLQSLAGLIAEITLSATLEAQTRDCTLVAWAVDPLLAVDVDRDLLCSAVGNVLQNAFKFTHPHSEVRLSAYSAGERILIDVADCCGGLPAGDPANMFMPFTQAGPDKTGLGLGLSIARRSAEANLGTLSVRDRPGIGCVFTISLPRYSVATPHSMETSRS